MAVLLAASEPEFFNANFANFLETLLKVKDKTVRPYALEALRYLLVAYLSRNMESSDEVLIFSLPSFPLFPTVVDCILGVRPTPACCKFCVSFWVYQAFDKFRQRAT